MATELIANKMDISRGNKDDREASEEDGSHFPFTGAGYGSRRSAKRPLLAHCHTGVIALSPASRYQPDEPYHKEDLCHPVDDSPAGWFVPPI